jgi:hypothetical protein
MSDAVARGRFDVRQLIGLDARATAVSASVASSTTIIKLPPFLVEFQLGHSGERLGARVVSPALVDGDGDGPILHREPGRIEDRDVVLALAAWLFAEEHERGSG